MRLIYNANGNIVAVTPDKMPGTGEDFPAPKPYLSVLVVPDASLPTDLETYVVQNGALVQDAARVAAKQATDTAKAAKTTHTATLADFKAMKEADFLKLTANQQAKALFAAIQALLNA